VSGILLVCGVRVKDHPEGRRAFQQPMSPSGLHFTATIPFRNIPDSHDGRFEVTFDMLPESIRNAIDGRPYEILNVQVHFAQ